MKNYEFRELGYSDHAGAIPELIKRAPQAKVLISPQATPMLKAITNNENIDFETVWTNKELKLGEKTIKFLTTPYLHWPETMSSYVVEDSLLFSGDVFGSHYYDSRLFDDLVGDFSYAVNFTFMFPVISLLCFHLFHSKFPRGNKV